jgi:hypothetical protein
MEYLMGTLIVAYKEFEQRLEMTAGYGTKQPAVRDFVRSRIVDEFSLDDIRSATPASDPLIKKVLQELRAGGAIEVVQRGRYARYRRLHTNF